MSTVLPSPGEDFDFAEYEGKLFPILDAYNAYTKFIFLLKNERTRFLAVILMEIATGKLDLNSSQITNTFVGESLIGLKVATKKGNSFRISEVTLVVAKAVSIYFDTLPQLKNNIIRGADLNTQITFPFSLFNSKTKVLRRKSLSNYSIPSQVEESLDGEDDSDDFLPNIYCEDEDTELEKNNNSSSHIEETSRESEFGSKMRDFLSSL